MPDLAGSNSNVNGVSIFSINIQCLLAKLAELIYHLKVHRPHVVLIQETWLDPTTKDVQIAGYVEVSRRDRHAGANRGGVLILKRDDFNGLVHIRNCEDEERSLYFLRLGVDTILVANWYRPGATTHTTFANLYTEMNEFFHDVSGIVIAGDLNIHHKKWLRFSNANTEVGADLKTFCDFHGLRQIVKEPIRGDYLLDLACPDIQKCTATVTPYITDHKGLLQKLPIPEVLEKTVSREVWILSKADWTPLRDDLKNFDRSPLSRGSAEDSLTFFLEILWLHLIKYIPRKTTHNKKSTHPWLTQKCKDAIVRKNAAEGSEQFANERDNFTAVMNAERANYVTELKEKISSSPRNDKKWWRLNRELLIRKSSVASIPTLREDTQWLSDSKAKADAFERKSISKSQLPAETIDCPYAKC